MSLAGVTTIPGTTNMLVAELLTTQGAAIGGHTVAAMCQSHLCVWQPVARVPSQHMHSHGRGCCPGVGSCSALQRCCSLSRSHCCSSAVCCCCCSSPGMGANLVALYDYNRVITSGTSHHQPLQRFVGHTDVVTAVAAGDDVFKECFLSGAWWGAAGRRDGKQARRQTVERRPAPRLCAAAVHVCFGRTSRDRAEGQVWPAGRLDSRHVCVWLCAAASKDKNVMIWDTRSSSGTPVATLGVRAGEQRTTHTGEQAHARTHTAHPATTHARHTLRVRCIGAAAACVSALPGG